MGEQENDFKHRSSLISDEDLRATRLIDRFSDSLLTFHPLGITSIE